MADKLRNEATIQLADQERTMRATFGALRAIERDLHTNLIPLIEKIGRGDVGIEQASVVIFHGLHGADDKRLSLEQVGEAVMKAGLGAVLEPVVNFLSIAMAGQSMGKPQDAA